MKEKNLPFLLIILTVFILGITTGCKKTKTDPCEGLLNESPPSEIVVRCVDKKTREPLVINAAVLKITDKQSGEPYTNWNVFNRNAFPILNGDIVLSIFNETPGEHQYFIKIGQLGTLALSFRIGREETGNACKPYSYPMQDIKVVNQPFSVFQYEGKAYPKILIVPL